MSDSERKQIRGGFFGRKFGETPGERTFNALDWGLIGYGANTAVSVAISDWARSGKLHYGVQLGNRWITTPLFQSVTGTKDLGEHAETYRELEKQAKAFLISKNLGKFPDSKVIEGMAPVRPFRLLAKHGFEPEFLRSLEKSLPHVNAENYTQTVSRATRFLSTERNAALFNGFLLLGTGGWLLTAPIKYLEDHKSEIVRHFDDKYVKTHNLTDAQKAEIAKRHDEIDAEPLQTWGSVLGARAMMYPVVVGAYMGLGRERDVNLVSTLGHSNKRLRQYTGTDFFIGSRVHKLNEWLHEKPLLKPIFDKVEEKLAVGPAKVAAEWGESVDPKSPLANPNRVGFKPISGKERLEKIAADTGTEVVYSGGMAGLTFATSRVLGPLLGDKRAKVEPARLPPTAPANDDTPMNRVASMEYGGRSAAAQPAFSRA